MKSLFLDFDGTMALSHELVYECLLFLFKKYNFKWSSDQLRNIGSEKIIAELGIPNWKLVFYMLRARRYLRPKMHSVPMQKGYPELLQELKLNGWQIFILSTNSKKNISQYLKDKNILPFVDQIYSCSSFLGKQKCMAQILKKHKILEQDCVYVGDETRDFIAMQKANIEFIGVEWGFHSKELLSAYGVQKIASSTQELGQWLQKH